MKRDTDDILLVYKPDEEGEVYRQSLTGFLLTGRLHSVETGEPLDIDYVVVAENYTFKYWGQFPDKFTYMIKERTLTGETCWYIKGDGALITMYERSAMYPEGAPKGYFPDCPEGTVIHRPEGD